MTKEKLKKLDGLDNRIYVGKNNEIKALLSTYPRSRPQLSDAVAKLYENQYIINRRRETIASKLSWYAESWMHRKVASDLYQNDIPPRVLEIGAGDLNHLEYEPYISHYDVVEPFTRLYKTSNQIYRITNHYSDMNDIPISAKYDRIISIAAFEHISSLPIVIARCGLHLSRVGSLRVAVPSEGGLLWQLGWRLTTGLEFYLKYQLDYGEIMRHEHLNNVTEIENILRFIFNDVSIQRFGLTKHFSLYTFFCCKQPNIERCQELL